MTYATAHGNAGSLTHRAGPGIKPTSSWIFIGFVTSGATVGSPRRKVSLIILSLLVIGCAESVGGAGLRDKGCQRMTWGLPWRSTEEPRGITEELSCTCPVYPFRLTSQVGPSQRGHGCRAKWVPFLRSRDEFPLTWYTAFRGVLYASVPSLCTDSKVKILSSKQPWDFLFPPSALLLRDSSSVYVKSGPWAQAS